MKRHKDAPFALVGINTGDSEDTFRSDSKELGLTWPCLFQGQGASPVSDLYQVMGYPTIFVVDSTGKIRSTDARGPSLGKLVDQLLAEME